MSTSATYRLAVKWVDDNMLTAVNRKRAFGRWYASRNEHLPTEAWEGLQPAWDAFLRETGGDSNWTKPVPQEVVDQIKTALDNPTLALEQRAYKDGYQQGFYDGARGNPSRFEVL